MLIAWKVTFDFQLEGSDEWRPDTAIVISDEHGGKAVNYVQEKMLGSEVDLTVMSSVEGVPISVPVIQTHTISGWRLTGLEKVGKVNFMDASVLQEAGFIEAAEQVVEYDSGGDQPPAGETTGSENASEGCPNCVGEAAGGGVELGD